MPLPAPTALLPGGRCRPQRSWGSSSLPPYQRRELELTPHRAASATPSTRSPPHGRGGAARSAPGVAAHPHTKRRGKGPQRPKGQEAGRMERAGAGREGWLTKPGSKPGPQRPWGSSSLPPHQKPGLTSSNRNTPSLGSACAQRTKRSEPGPAPPRETRTIVSSPTCRSSTRARPGVEGSGARVGGRAGGRVNGGLTGADKHSADCSARPTVCLAQRSARPTVCVARPTEPEAALSTLASPAPQALSCLKPLGPPPGLRPKPGPRPGSTLPTTHAHPRAGGAARSAAPLG